VRELESSLQQFGEFLLKSRFVKEAAAPYCVRFVRQFLSCPATDEALVDRVRRFCEDLERTGSQEWQVRQAEHALRLYFVNFLERTDWHRTSPSPVIDANGQVTQLAALEQLRQRLRARHYSYRTEESYTDWARRFLDYLADRQRLQRPRVDSTAVRDYATHLAVRHHVSASTQNQAISALLFLCREVLGLDVEALSLAARAKRGTHLPIVLSMPETAALLDAMRGTARLMATLIYGGGLHLSECCELRVKDLDFDRGSPSCAAVRVTRTGRRCSPSQAATSCRHTCAESEALHKADPQARVRPHIAPLLRNAPAAERSRYPADPGLPWARQRRDDDDLLRLRTGNRDPPAAGHR